MSYSQELSAVKEKSVPYGLSHSRYMAATLIAITFYFGVHGIGLILQQQEWSYVSGTLPAMNTVCFICSIFTGFTVYKYFACSVRKKRNEGACYAMFYLKIITPIVVFITITAAFFVFSGDNTLESVTRYFFHLSFRIPGL